MRKKNKVLSKQVGVMLSDESYDLLECMTSRIDISMSEFIREIVEKRLIKFKSEELNFWENMDTSTFHETIESLTNYLKSRLSKEIDKYTCPNSHDLENTKEYCRQTNILFELLKEHIDGLTSHQAICDCRLLQILETKILKKEKKMTENLGTINKNDIETGDLLYDEDYEKNVLNKQHMIDESNTLSSTNTSEQLPITDLEI